MKQHQLPLLLAIATGLAAILTPISAHAGAYAFVTTGNLADGGRFGHPAVRLADGRVLVVGGDQATGQTASAETYNPSSGNWSLSGPMSTQRDNHTANLLPDGRVLVAGGAYIIVFASTEIWNPTTGEFTPGLPMNVARHYHTSVGLADGRILVAGGYGVGGFAQDSAEIYDPAAGTWTSTVPMTTSRLAFAAVRLADGRVLITGGSKGPEGGFTSIENCEIYNPSSGTFTSVAPMSKARNYHGAALLADGRVLVVGGSQNIGPIYYNDAEIYDPSANAWTSAGSLTAGGNGVSLTRLSDGHVLAVGGVLFYSGAATNAADLFDPVTSTFSPLAPMNVVRGYHSATLLGDGSVLLAGGADFSVSPSAISSAERFITMTNIVVTPANPIIGIGTNQQFTTTGNYNNGSSRTLTGGGGVWATKTSMPSPRATMALGVVNGVLYAAGGFTGMATTSAVNTFEAYDPVADGWTSKASMPTVRHQAGAAAVNGILYVIGGLDASSQQLSVVEAYDPVSNTWSTKTPMPTARGAFAIGVVSNVIYAVGGVYFAGGGGFTTATVEAYDPATDSWTTKAAMPTSRYVVAGGVVNNILYAVGGSLVDGTPLTTVEAYNPASNSWSAKTPMPAAHNSYGIGTINGVLYLASGSEFGVIGPTPTVLAYDPAANAWSEKSSIMTPRANLAGAVVNGVLYAVGGQNSGGVPVTTVEAFTPPEVTWSSGTPAVATLDSNGLAAGLSVGSSTITASAWKLSANTTLTVVTQPAITNQPMNATAGANGSVTLSVGANGGGLTYQWRLNGTNLAGANGASLTLSGLDASQAGVYSVVVSNVAGVVTSSAATLSLLNLHMYAGLTIVGQVGGTYQIDYRNDLNSTNWFNLTNVVLPSSPYLFIDPASPQHAQRFYRAMLSP